MWLNLDVCGIKIQLRINGYRPSTKNDWDSQWCTCDFDFSSGDWLNYHRECTEIMLSCEVEELESTLSQLLNDELKVTKEIACIEPDFVFTFYPKKDLRQDPNYSNIQSGYEFLDCYMEWKIYFWHGGLTDNFLTVTLGREEMSSFKNYLSSITRK